MMFILGVYIYSRWNHVLRLETFKSLFEALFTQGAWARSDAMPQCDTMKETGLCVHSKDISLCPKAIRRHCAQGKRRKVWMTLLYIKLKIPKTLIPVPRFCHFEVPPLSLWKVEIKFCLSLHSSKWNFFFLQSSPLFRLSVQWFSQHQNTCWQQDGAGTRVVKGAKQRKFQEELILTAWGVGCPASEVIKLEDQEAGMRPLPWVKCSWFPMTRS